jgi:hypothetical protein
MANKKLLNECGGEASMLSSAFQCLKDKKETLDLAAVVRDVDNRSA